MTPCTLNVPSLFYNSGFMYVYRMNDLHCVFHAEVRLSLSGNYLISSPLQSFTRNYFIFMVGTLQGRASNTVILLELKLNVRTKMIFRAM